MASIDDLKRKQAQINAAIRAKLREERAQRHVRAGKELESLWRNQAVAFDALPGVKTICEKYFGGSGKK